MTRVLRPTSCGRLLALVSHNNVSTVLNGHVGLPIAALLTFHDPVGDPSSLEPVVASLLDAGCDYFVCFGEASEALHDFVDDLILVQTPPEGSTGVTTTWHDYESATDVSEYFLDVAGAKENSLLMAVV